MLTLRNEKYKFLALLLMCRGKWLPIKRRQIASPSMASIQTQIWGLWRQKQVSQAGISNCIPQSTVGCNYLSLPEIPASGTKVLIYEEQYLHIDGLVQEREREIKFIGLFENRGHRGPYSPYKPFNHNLYIGIIIFPHIDNPQSTGYS